MTFRRASLATRPSLALVTAILVAAGCSDRPLPGDASAVEPQLAASLEAASASGVVISQVYGGGGNSGAPYTNDFVELFNPGAAPVSIEGWSIQYASATGSGNLGANSSQLVALAGSIAPGKYHLIQLGGGATGSPLPTPDVTGTINMSGSSGKVALVRQSTTLGCNGGSTPCNSTQLALIEDLVGYGSANFFETAATPALSNSTAAIRKSGGAQDTGNNSADFDVGAPTPRNSASGVVISQVYGGGGNSGAPYTNDFVELFNPGAAPVSIEGWSVQYASATGSGNLGANSSQLVALAGSIAPGKYHLIQLGGGATGSPLPTPDVTGTINMSGSSGKVALVRQSTTLGCNGGSTPCNSTQLALIEDLVGYGSANFFETAATPALSNSTAAIRKSGGAQDTGNNSADFDVGAPTPRNSATGGGGGGGGGGGDDPLTCAAPFTPIPTIQGSGAATTLSGTVVTEGVVVGDYEGPSPTLRGFYLQAATGDGDPATSDGIFVFNGNANSVALGDAVRVSGTVAEFQGQTQISAATITACGTGTVTPVDVTLPVPSADYLERFEGMLVRFPQALTVTEHFQLGRFGQVVMSSGGRLAQPTNVVAPGAGALVLQAANDLNRVIVDDALQNQNADPILFGRGGNPLSATNTLRGGDQATGMVGVLTYTWAGNGASGNAYRLRPVGALGGGIPAFVAVNPRPATPTPVGGSLAVASLNVLNYFNTFGNTNCANGLSGAVTQCRGANNATEFERQRAKTIAAVVTMNADIVGLMEIENDGYGPTSAVQDLVNGLNDATAPGTWAFIDADAGTGQVNALGTDAIKVALIYQPAKVAPTGRTAALNTVSFVTGGDSEARNRPALAQAFIRTDGGRLVVAVNHLKSKGSACDAPDLGDGQANCAAVRTAAAQELAAWLAADPTDTGELDALIIGDLNSYAMEDPITAIRNAGFTNLVSTFGGASAYGYAFDGQWGYLDHALASATLASQVAGVTEWHVNADEPNVLDYNVEFKSAGQVASLYAPDPFRNSDHDPVIVGLNLTPPPVDYAFGGFLAPIRSEGAMTTADAGSTIPVRFSLGGDQGMQIFLAGFPASRPVSCTTGAVLGGFTSASNPGGSALSYARGNRVYNFGWKTDAAWTGSCRELVLRFQDETQERVVVDFRP